LSSLNDQFGVSQLLSKVFLHLRETFLISKVGLKQTAIPARTLGELEDASNNLPRRSLIILATSDGDRGRVRLKKNAITATIADLLLGRSPKRSAHTGRSRGGQDSFEFVTDALRYSQDEQGKVILYIVTPYLGKCVHTYH
jgi:hypothetical protein